MYICMYCLSLSLEQLWIDVKIHRIETLAFAIAISRCKIECLLIAQWWRISWIIIDNISSEWSSKCFYSQFDDIFQFIYISMLCMLCVCGHCTISHFRTEFMINFVISSFITTITQCNCNFKPTNFLHLVW